MSFREMRNLEEERRENNLLLERKRKELEKLQIDLQERVKRTSELQCEQKTIKEQVAQVRYNNVRRFMNTYDVIYVKITALA